MFNNILSAKNNLLTFITYVLHKLSVLCVKKIKHYEILIIPFELCVLMGNPIPALNPTGMGMGKKYPRLLNGDGDEKALPDGEQTRCHP